MGFSGTELTDHEFREQTWQGAREIADLTVQADVWAPFASFLSYVQGNLTSPEDYADLREKLEEIESEKPVNRMYYLSLAPSLYAPATNNLAASGALSRAALLPAKGRARPAPLMEAVAGRRLPRTNVTPDKR